MRQTSVMQRNPRLRSALAGVYRLAVWALLAVTFWAGLGHADKAPPPPPSAPSAAAPVADKDGFVPESRPPAMNNVEAGLPAAPLVGAAYGFIWLAVFGFVVFTLRRTTQLEADIADLRERIARTQAGSQ